MGDCKKNKVIVWTGTWELMLYEINRRVILCRCLVVLCGSLGINGDNISLGPRINAVRVEVHGTVIQYTPEILLHLGHEKCFKNK